MKVFINKQEKYYAPIKYVLKIIEKNRKIQFSFEEDVINADIIWDHHNPNSQSINLEFYSNLDPKSNLLKHETFFNGSMTHLEKKEETQDLISIIFYLVNCIQELNPLSSDLDHFHRFKYTSSYQYKNKNIKSNLVESLIDDFCKKHQLKGEKTKSNFFISHDIDTIYGSFLQDGFWALKNMKIGVVLNLIAYELSRNPHWKNIDKIISVNNEYDVKSTFFWLVNKGIGTQNIKNADYNIKKESALLNLVSQSDNTNGLHKSCSSMSINKELEKGQIQSNFNRYHFLNFRTHTDWQKISDSKLTFDCSLGFAEHYGFRNSYGKAFQPFNISSNQPYNFVEAPLHFMDGTFHKYMKMPTQEIGRTIIDFYQKNELNCNFSLLWHNTYFTDYKYNSFLKEYKKVLSFIYENKIECVTPQDLINQNLIQW